MNRERKVELLYRKAKGQSMNASPAEIQELSRYGVDFDEGDFITTRKNIADYVKAVDNGCRTSFYDWCMNNNRADRRRKGGSEAELQTFGKQQTGAVMFVGWLTWGMAIYWFFQAEVSVGICAVLGAVISVALFKCTRKVAMFTVILLPIILAAIFGSR